MTEKATSKSLNGSSELLLVMPIRQGFVDCLDTRTYKSRLQTVAKVFNDMRVTSRESRILQPFSDIVDRIRTIHSVHIAVIEPDQVLLSVCFDQPWEPYIRVVWHDLGSLLDTILCNCEGYSGVHSSDQGFDAFATWVRDHQINADTYYFQDSHTTDDIVYLENLQRLYIEDAANLDVRASNLKVSTPEAKAQRLATLMTTSANANMQIGYVKLGVRAITAFHALTHLYPQHTRDHQYLQRAAAKTLSEFKADGDWAKKEEFAQIAAFFKYEIDWFNQAVVDNQQSLESKKQAGSVSPLNYKNIQGGILDRYAADVGCLVLVQITNVAKAQTFLHDYSERITNADRTDTSDQYGAVVYRNLAFTYAGLTTLGMPADQLDQFPREFQQGMAARAGLLGDVRSNHPDQWQLPKRNWSTDEQQQIESEHRVNVNSVDVVFQFRTSQANIAHSLTSAHPFAKEIQLLTDNSGLSVASVQPMYHRDKNKEHFGFSDGLSQPEIEGHKHTDTTTNKLGDYNNEVSADEFLIGLPSKNDQQPTPAPDFLLNGTFMVLRKLEQDVESFKEFAEIQTKTLNTGLSKGLEPWSEQQVLEKLVGRKMDGVPLLHSSGADPEDDHIENGFSFDDDPNGDSCPIHSHIRRSNPREPGKKIPRIMRRGMSYGPAYESATKDDERGLMFIAYNANIAEQFEVIQRWVSGGNSTGSYSEYADPILGVPYADKSRLMPINHKGSIARFDLGTRQFVKLRWGTYLFVPSISAIRQICQPHPSPANLASKGAELLHGVTASTTMRNQSNSGQTTSLLDAASSAATLKTRLEEKNSLDSLDGLAIWAAIRENEKGVLRTPGGVMVGDPNLIAHVLASDNYSVEEYQNRLKKCIGANYLGLDGESHAKQSAFANEQISAITIEEGFNTGIAVLDVALENLATIPGDLDIPISKYADVALAAIGRVWFGVPDGEFIQLGGNPVLGSTAAHCPHHFGSPSRFIFQPWPTPAVEEIASMEGNVLREKMLAYTTHAFQNQNLSKLALEISADYELPEQLEQFTSVLMGALLGFMPTVQGNFITVLREWNKSGLLWRIQDQLRVEEAKHANKLSASESIILPHLTQTMADRPVPALIHRTAVQSDRLNGLEVRPGDKIVLGLVSASSSINEQAEKLEPIFGGTYGEQVHACPGRKLAMGTLLAMIYQLLKMPGTLRETTSALAVRIQQAPT